MNNENDLFEQAVTASEKVEERPDNETMLKLYALYKQGTEGDISGEKPGFFDFIAVAKYESWEKLANTSREDARAAYVSLVHDLGGSV